MAQGQEIDRLFVKIEGDIAGLKASMTRATAEVDKAQKGMSSGLAQIVRSFSSVDGAAVRVAGGAGLAAAALLKGGQTAVRYADDLADTATALGVNVERLQEYRYAATQAGVSQEELDRALMKLNISIGDAVRNGGPAAEKFKALGIEVTDAAGNVRATDEVLRDLADRLSKIPSAAERAAAAGDLLGDKLGPKMQAMLARGAAYLDELGAAAHRVGAVMDKETIDKAGEAQDKMDALAMVTKAQLTTALVDLAPVLISVSGGIALVAEYAGKAAIALKAMFGASAYGEIEEDIIDLDAKIALVKRKIEGPSLNATKFLNPEAWERGTRKAREELRQLEETRELFVQKQAQLFGQGTPAASTTAGAGGAGAETPAEKKSREEREKARAVELERQAAFFEAYESMQYENDQAVTASRNAAAATLQALTAEAHGDLINSELAKNAAILASDQATADQRLAAIEAQQAIQTQLENEGFRARTEELLALTTASDEQEVARRAALEDLARAHQTNLTLIEQEGADARTSIIDAEWASRLAGARMAFGNLSSLMASESKKMFEIGKTAAIAETIVSTIESAGHSFNAGAKIGGPILGGVFAATAIIAGMARVQALKSTQFGSRGVSVGVGGNMAVNNPAPGGGATASGGGSEQVIYVKGLDPNALFTGSFMRNFISNLNQATGDGTRIEVVS